MKNKNDPCMQIGKISIKFIFYFSEFHIGGEGGGYPNLGKSPNFFLF